MTPEVFSKMGEIEFPAPAIGDLRLATNGVEFRVEKFGLNGAQIPAWHEVYAPTQIRERASDHLSFLRREAALASKRGHWRAADENNQVQAT